MQLVMHEGAHLLAAWLDQGLKPIGFYPYPHWYKGKFYFARYKVEDPVEPEEKYNTRHLAPVPLAIIHSVILAGLLGTFWCWWGATIIVPFLIMAQGDIAWWIRGYFWGTPTCDGKRWRYGDK